MEVLLRLHDLYAKKNAVGTLNIAFETCLFHDPHAWSLCFRPTPPVAPSLWMTFLPGICWYRTRSMAQHRTPCGL